MHRRFFAAYFAAQRTMATDENNHKNEARDDWTGCTFRVERGPSSEGRAWGMADILITKTHCHRAIDASSFSRLNPLRRRMNRRPLLESEFFAAAPPRVFFSRASLARRPQDGRRRLDALLAQGRHVVVYLQVPRLAHALRPGPVPTGQMREPARVVGRSPFQRFYA